MACSAISKAYLGQVKVVRERSDVFAFSRKQVRVFNVFANGAVRGSAVLPERISGTKSGEITGLSPAWSVLSEELSVGPFPRSPRDLELLVKSTAINAFVLLETEEGVKQSGLDWEDFRTRVNQQGAVAVRLSMKANDKKDQLTSLPEAVRGVAALAAMGYKVHVSCTNGIHRSPLVALAYLTLMKGLTLVEAWGVITKANPLAKPNVDVLKEVADKKLKEAFKRGVETDVKLSDAVAKAAAQRAIDTVSKAKGSLDTENNSATKDKLDFFARQLSVLKEKEESARKAAIQAEKEKEALSRQLNAIAAGKSAAPAPVNTPTAVATAPIVTKDPRLVKEQERALAKAQSTLKSATEKLQLVESSFSEAKAAGSSTDKVDFLQRQVEALKAKEAQAQKEVDAAKSALSAVQVSSSVSTAPQAAVSASSSDFSRKIEEQKVKYEAEKKQAEEKISTFSRQVSELKVKLAAADVLQAENEKKIGDLSQQIDEYQRKEKESASARDAQSERLAFFSRHMASLRDKEEAARKAAKKAAEHSKSLERKLADLASRESVQAEKVRELSAQVGALMQLNTEQGLELQETKQREQQLMQVLEDGTGVLTMALESDKQVKQLKEEVKEALLKYEKERVRADLLAADLEKELIAAGKKPKHYNDIEKVPSVVSDLERQLLSQLATTKQTLVASGTSLGLAVDQDSSAGGILLRDVVLGALSMAAVPFTLMSIFSDAQPSRMAELIESPSATMTETYAEILKPEEVIPPEPIVKSTNPEDFCKQTLTGSRSARVERFCQSLAEINGS